MYYLFTSEFFLATSCHWWHDMQIDTRLGHALRHFICQCESKSHIHNTATAPNVSVCCNAHVCPGTATRTRNVTHIHTLKYQSSYRCRTEVTSSFISGWNVTYFSPVSVLHLPNKETSRCMVYLYHKIKVTPLPPSLVPASAHLQEHAGKPNLL